MMTMSECNFKTFSFSFSVWVLCNRDSQEGRYTGASNQNVRTPFFESIYRTIDFFIPEVEIQPDIQHVWDFPFVIGVTSHCFRKSVDVRTGISKTVTGSGTIRILISVTTSACGGLSGTTVRSAKFQEVDILIFQPRLFGSYPTCGCTVESSPTLVFPEIITTHAWDVSGEDITVGVVVSYLSVVWKITVGRCISVRLVTVSASECAGFNGVLTEFVAVT